MPGNCGNRRGGTGPVAIDTYPPTLLVSVVCDLHPLFLCKNSAPPSLRSQSDRVYISAPWNFIYLFLIWSRRHAESLPQLTGSASSVTWSSSHVREEDTRAKASQMKLSFIDHGSKQWQDAAEKKEKRGKDELRVSLYFTLLCVKFNCWSRPNLSDEVSAPFLGPSIPWWGSCLVDVLQCFTNTLYNTSVGECSSLGSAGERDLRPDLPSTSCRIRAQL